jgi:hypothetical protein
MQKDINNERKKRKEARKKEAIYIFIVASWCGSKKSASKRYLIPPDAARYIRCQQ